MEKIKKAELMAIQKLRGVGTVKLVSGSEIPLEQKDYPISSSNDAELNVFLSMIQKQPEEKVPVIEEKEKYTESDMDSFLANFIKK